MSGPVRIALATLWTIVVLVLLAMPATDVQTVDIANADKIGHLVVFFVLAFLWMAALRLDLRHRAMIVFAGGVLFAVGTEVLQGALAAGREQDVIDVVADLMGLLIGMAAYRAVHLRFSSAKV